MDVETEAARGRARLEAAEETATQGHVGARAPGKGRAVGRELVAGVEAAKAATARNANEEVLDHCSTKRTPHYRF